MELGMVIALVAGTAATGVAGVLVCRSLRRRPPRARKIVVFAPGTSDQEADRIVRSLKARVVKRLPLVNGAVCEFADPADATALSAHHQVARVDDDLLVHTCPCGLFRKKAVPLQPPETVPWGVARIEAPAAWDKLPPSPDAVDVAVLDTGVDLTHPDLSPNLAAGVNVLHPRRPPQDDNGHGTHVAGTIAALANTVGVVGVAPRARIIPVKVLDRDGSGRLSDIIEGLDWCVRQKVRVANLSLGSADGNPTFAEAVAGAVASGVVVVAAAGNAGPFPDTIGYPARYPQVIAVGATTRNDQVAEFSSRGEELDVVAPGEDILSTWPGGEYRELSGTSMATPHVSGLVALLLAAEPGLFPAQIRARLQQTATRLPEWTPQEQGAGLVNAPRALAGA